jgi:hypothetical protein
MKVWFKRIALSLGGLLALVALLIGVWFASNLIDADPAPWPAELSLAPSAPAPANPLYSAVQNAPLGQDNFSTQIKGCIQGNCLAAWRAQSAELLPTWTAQRAKQAAFGAACEAWVAQQPVPYAEVVPANWSPTMALPSYHRITRCNHWLLGSALAASEAGQADTALAQLALAQGLEQALLAGSHSLIGHMIALSMVEQRLQATLWVVDKHPSIAVRLQRLPGPSGAQIAAAQARWIAYEANFVRGANAAYSDADRCEEVNGAPQGQRAPAWLCKLQTKAMMPAHTEQLFARHWLAVLGQVNAANPLATANSVAHITASEPTGWFGSNWHWRGTVAHVLLDVARPAHKDYFDRSADAVLASAASELWLEAQATGAPAGQHTAWLSERVKAHPLGASLAQRLTVQADGSWLLQRGATARETQLTRWPKPA